MSNGKLVNCQGCGQEVPEGDSYRQGNQTLCEDCYLKGVQQVQACDPLAARSAEMFRQTSGIKSTEGLTALQKEICEFVWSRGKATAGELLAKFKISRQELENQVAVLRHCSLIKGHQERSKVYLVPF
jgi:late competence protein required for DNA uptake (superfamily II DNA/RNA helicase)